MENKYNLLDKLKELLDKGVLTESEFQEEKGKILNTNKISEISFFGMSENVYCMLLHLSVLAVFLHWSLLIIAPFLLWIINRESSEAINRQGKNVLNWSISFLIYLLVIGLIYYFIIGGFTNLAGISSFWLLSRALVFSTIPVIALIAILIVIAIIGSTKAYKGEEWKSPLAIQFIK